MDYFDFSQEISRWATSGQGDQDGTKEEDELNKLFHKSPQFGMAGRLYNKNIYRSPKQSRNGCRESKEVKTNQQMRKSVNRLSNPSRKQLVSSTLGGSNSNNNNNNDNKNDNELVKQQNDENNGCIGNVNTDNGMIDHNGSIGNLQEKMVEPLLSKYENYVPALLKAYFPNDPTMAQDTDFLNIRKLHALNKNDESSSSPRSKKDKKKGKEGKGLSFTQMRETVSKQLNNNENDKYNDGDSSDLFDINLISDREKHKRAMAKIEQGSNKLKNKKRRKHYRMNHHHHHHSMKIHENTPFHNNNNNTTTTTAAVAIIEHKNNGSSNNVNNNRMKRIDGFGTKESNGEKKKLFIQHNIKQIHVIQEKYLKGNNSSEESSIVNVKNHHRSVPRQRQKQRQDDHDNHHQSRNLLARHRYNQRLKPLLPSNIDKENGNENGKENSLTTEKDRKAMNDVTNLLSGIRQQSLSNIVSPITTSDNKIGLNNENNDVNNKGARKIKPSYTFHKSTFAHIQRFYKSPTAAAASSSTTTTTTTTTNDNGKEKERDIDGDNRSKFLKNVKGNFCSNSNENINQIAVNNNNDNNYNKMWQSRSCDSIMRKNGELTFLQPTKAASIKRRSKYMNNNHDSSSNSSMKVAANGDNNNKNNNNGGSSQSMIDLLLNENILPHYMLGTRTRLGISDVSEQYKTENEMSAKETIKSLQQLLNEQHNEIDQMEKLKEKRAVWRQRGQKKMENGHSSNYVANVKLNLSPTSTKAKIVSKTPKLELRAANKSASPSIISIDSSIFNVN